MYTMKYLLNANYAQLLSVRMDVSGTSEEMIMLIFRNLSQICVLNLIGFNVGVIRD